VHTDVIPQINGVTLRAHSSELSTIQALPYVVGANPDEEGDLLSGANHWSLDAINVTDFGATPPRVVGYDGAGVYVAVIDSGLPFNWRAYFPEERIAVDLARSFWGWGRRSRDGFEPAGDMGTRHSRSWSRRYHRHPRISIQSP